MMNIARLLVITAAIAAMACAPEKKDTKEGSATSNSEADKTFRSVTQYVASPAMQKTNQALVLTSSSVPAPLGQCVATVDIVDPASRAILVSYNNCNGIFAGAPPLYSCSNGYVCEATNGDLSTFTQYGSAAVITPYGGAAVAGPVASATVQYMYRIVLGNRTVNITRTMLNIGTSGTSNTQDFTFATSVPPTGYRPF